MEDMKRAKMSTSFISLFLFLWMFQFSSVNCQIIDGVLSARSLRHEVVHPTKTCLDGYCRHVHLSLSTIGGQDYEFLLVRNEELVADDYFIQIDDGEPFIPLEGRSGGSNEENDCYYQSRDSGITAAVSLCNNKVEGIFTLKNESFILQFDHELGDHCLFRYHDLPQVYWIGESQVDLSALKNYADQFLNRPLPVGRAMYEVKPKNKYLEVLYIIDKAMFVQAMESSYEKASKFVKSLVNRVGATFKNLTVTDDVMNFHYVLKGLIIWSKSDPFKGSPDIMFHLIEFLNYNFENIYPIHEQDHAVLITGRHFPDTATTLGIALRSTICQRPELAAVMSVFHKGSVLNGLAATIAHETGHSLGFWDEQYYTKWNCQGSQNFQCLGGCPSDQCIMRSCSDPTSRIQKVEWSTCTRRTAQSRWDDGRYFCLGNRPFHRNTSIEAISSCGNGVIEYGEQCDCTIGDRECSKNCCDMFTCTLKIGAKCSSGLCCNRADCLIKNKGEHCRKKVDETCDREDTCDGSSEICFDNVAVNVTYCNNSTSNWCKNGKCVPKCFKNCFAQGKCEKTGDGHECKCEGLFYGKFCQFKFGIIWHIVLGCVLGGISCTLTSIVFALQDRYFNKDQV